MQDSEYIVNRAKRLKALQLLGNVCKLCNESRHYVLDFHHLNNKDYGISTLLNLRWSKIEKEIKKCDLLCGNCHAESHYKEGRNGLVKKSFLFDIQKLKCERCGYVGKNFASLDFHHKDKNNKKFNLTKYFHRQLQNKYTLQDLLNEAEKCVLLCRNCHREEHYDSLKFKRFEKKIFQKIKNIREIRPKINRDMIYDMYFNKNMKQCEIVKYFNCQKGTISLIIKKIKQNGCMV